jgi:serine/threonine protein kinase
MRNIGDFGFAAYKKINKLNSYRGTKTYMAPEIMIENEYDGKSVELFAAAIVLFIMYAGTPAFG